MLLPIEEVKQGMILANDVYLHEDIPIPMLTEKTVLTDRMINKLRESGIQIVPVVVKKKALPFPVPTPKPIISKELRIDAINNLTHVFELARLGQEKHHFTAAIQVIKQLDAIVNQLVDCLTSDNKALINITDLKSYDEYTYNHSLSVAVLTITIANELGFSLQNLALAGRSAMLHDIGKTAIPIEIIQKPGRLTNKEFELVKTHPSEGYKYLVKGNIGDNLLWQNVLCHHEKLNGTGYPMAFKEDEIPLISRIISVADVYDALTSNRSYRSPMEPQEAMEYIMANIGEAFDFNIVRAFMRKLELYPIGSFIQLSNEKDAIVMSNENSMRPLVRLVDTGELLDLDQDYHCLNLTVKRFLPEQVPLQQYAN